MIKESYYYYYYYSASRRLSAIAERAILRGRPPRNPTPAGILAMAHCLSVPVCHKSKLEMVGTISLVCSIEPF